MITLCLSPSTTHAGWPRQSHCDEEGEGTLTARQRAAGGEMRPIFSSEPELLFQDWIPGARLREAVRQQQNKQLVTTKEAKPIPASGSIQ